MLGNGDWRRFRRRCLAGGGGLVVENSLRLDLSYTPTAGKLPGANHVACTR
jgi:hypothetical protein